MKPCRMNHRINALLCAAAIGAFAMVGCKDREPDVPSPTVTDKASGKPGGQTAGSGNTGHRGKPHNYDR